jgi:hypothetical protein
MRHRSAGKLHAVLFCSHPFAAESAPGHKPGPGKLAIL